MKLLILTQVVDEKDTGLSFFHRWIELLSQEFSSVTVVCLKKGTHHFAANVRVFSLGKEEHVSRLTYLLRFYSIIFRERREYDAVFVHMNQEYVLLAGLLWRMWGKRIVLWYNHTFGSFLTRVAYSLSNVVLYTSSFSYGAVQKIKNGKQVGAGIDTDYFDGDQSSAPPSSVLFLGRISPVKKVLEFALALTELHERGVAFKATICGDLGSPGDAAYYQLVRGKLKPLIDGGFVSLQPGVPHEKTKDLYLEHRFYVNLTQTGSFDKTVLEAMSLRRFVIVLNRSFEGILPQKAMISEPLTGSKVAEMLQNCLTLSQTEINEHSESNREYVVKNHNLPALILGVCEALK